MLAWKFWGNDTVAGPGLSSVPEPSPSSSTTSYPSSVEQEDAEEKESENSFGFQEIIDSSNNLDDGEPDEMNPASQAIFLSMQTPQPSSSSAVQDNRETEVSDRPETDDVDIKYPIIIKDKRMLKMFRSAMTYEGDEDMHFLKSLHPSLKRIPGNRKLRMRQMIRYFIISEVEIVEKLLFDMNDGTFTPSSGYIPPPYMQNQFPFKDMNPAYNPQTQNQEFLRSSDQQMYPCPQFPQ